MPLTIFNLSKADHLYIGRDTVVTFAEEPTIDTYHIEVASEEKIKEHLAKPCNWVPKRHETLPEIQPDTAFLCSPGDVPGPHRVQLQDKDITTNIRQKFEELCEEYGEAFSKNNEDISRTKLIKMEIDTGDSPPVSSRPYTLPLKHYEWAYHTSGGYHHIALGKSSRAKTAFVMPFGKYEFLMVPFGSAQAPAYFQLLMNKVINGLKFAMTYLDDIIIFSKNESQHLEHLKTVFSHLREVGLKMKWSKCNFFKSKIHYLGHLIFPKGISPLPNKLDCIQHMPAPKNVKEIKQFLALTGYYRKFVPRFADILRPLTTLTKKDKKFEWTPACQKSFDLLKETLCGEPVLKYADTSKPYTLYTDASKFGWAGVLAQSHTTVIDSPLLLIIQSHLSVVCSEAANSTGLP